MKKYIPFNRPYLAGKELEYIKQAVKSGKISGDGEFSQKCVTLMKKRYGVKEIFLTPSCSAALEMTGLLLKIKPGDEVIVPSFTFPSTINAFVIFGGRPVFVDIRGDTLNIDEEKIEEKITKKTRAIYCMHYAGVACRMEKILEIVKRHHLYLVEDAAQAMEAKYKGNFLGTFGDLAAFSFHETKNYHCGEGGALLINNPKFIERAKIIREKGTNRTDFFVGKVREYTWKDVGSSYLLSEILAAYLYAQLEHLQEIKEKRQKAYQYYFYHLKKFEEEGKLRLPFIPGQCQINYHLFYLLFNSGKERERVMKALRQAGILAVYHYLPLHLSPMGKKFGYKKGDFPLTEDISQRLLRLPLYNDISESELNYVCRVLKKIL